MENLEVKIIIANDKQKATATFNLKEYQKIKEQHDYNVINELINILLDEIKKQTTSND